jgi:glucose/mannose-6-phosphate isomerase
MTKLSFDQIMAVDAARQVHDIVALPDHLRAAMSRVRAAGLDQGASASCLVVAGMGGSAIGADLARGVTGADARRPMVVVRGYELPSWVPEDAAVLCASYSGNTEETLAVYEQAAGLRRIVATTGGRLAKLARADGVEIIELPAGLQPRAAVAYALVVALEVGAAVGCFDSTASQVEEAAQLAAVLADTWGPNAPEDSLAKELARGLHGTVPQIAGAGATEAIAYRWKTQINENAKMPCSAHSLPELDHNEIVGWQRAAELGRFSAVFLDDPALDPRLRRRIELTYHLVAPRAAACYRVRSIGDSALERALSLVLLGDLVSLYLAVLAGLDPSPVRLIEEFKISLAAMGGSSRVTSPTKPIAA